RYNFATDTIGRWATDPAHLAMVHVDQHGGERAISFADFARRSDRLASALRQHGIGPGDRVLVVLPRVPEWWEAVLAIMKVGAISLPGTTLLRQRDLAYRIAASGAKGIITDPEVAARVDDVAGDCPTLTVPIVVGGERAGWIDYEAALAAAPADFAPVRTRSDDPCMLYFTSGTTAHPKMVLHTHASYPLGHLVTGRYWLDLRPGDLHWNLADTGWAKAAWSSLFGPWSVGATLFIHDARGKFDAGQTLATLERFPITSFCAAPTIYRMLVLENLAAVTPRALRSCVGAGEPLNPEVIETWRAATGLTIRDGYGQTESAVLVANFPTLPVRVGSMGKPTPGFDVAIVDDAGRELPPGEEGHIAVRITPQRPVGLFHGYYGDPALTSQVFAGEWYYTGDRATRDEDGYFWFVGRADDVILSAGYRISPFEVESALIEHPAVAEAAVVGSPDPIRGQIVKAFVVLVPGTEPSDALAQELQAFTREITAPYKYPREVEFVPELPKTISGKIRRVDLRAREAARKGAARD
ncbi:MAG: AMP-binding protein, partial [Sphaerobacter sp.]|nr:AMP-binding protein [Sphaerobacter sp.]